MRGLLAVTGRELHERRRLLAVAVFVGAAPAALPPLGLGGREEWRLATILGAFTFTVATAVLSGASVVGRDLSEGRLGFFFARPISGASIWGGKMLAALLLSVGVLLLSGASLPWLGLRGPSSLLPGAAAWVVPALVTLVVVTLIGLGHAFSVGYRSRSAWFAADLILAVLSVPWIVNMVGRLLFHLVLPPVFAFFAVTASALTAAGAAQVIWGRTDVRSGHRVLSAVLWTAMFLGLAAIEARTRWLLNPGWDDLVALDEVRAAPQGAWSAVIGRTEGRGQGRWLFLADGASGRRVPVGTAHDLEFAFAPDGRRAAWLAFPRQSPSVSLSVLDLDGGARTARTRELSLGVPLAGAVGSVTDGRRLVLLEGGAALVADLDGDRPPLRVPLPPGVSRQAAYLDGERLRLFHATSRPGQAGSLRLLDVNLSSGTLSEAGHIQTRSYAWVRVSPDRTRILVLDRPERHPALTLHAGDGARLATLIEAGTAVNVQADFLADGRIAIVQTDASARLRLLSPDGTGERSVELATRPAGVRLGAEAAPGQLTVGLDFIDGQRRETVLLDADDARVVRRYPDLSPAATPWFAWCDAGARPAPGSPATHLFLDVAGNTFTLDMATGGRRAAFARSH